MILRTGSCRSRNNELGRRAGFTLIELILVMALLLIVLGVSSPQLQRFFRGRNLDSEARRFLSLTEYGHSRAVSEGIPVILWMDPKQGLYGLRAAAGYLDPDPDAKEVQYELDQNLRMEIPANARVNTLVPVVPDRITGNLPSIRFGPDGFITLSSPELIYLIQGGAQGDGDIVAVVQSTNRLRYELQPVNNIARR